MTVQQFLTLMYSAYTSKVWIWPRGERERAKESNNPACGIELAHWSSEWRMFLGVEETGDDLLQQKCTVAAYNTTYGHQLVMRVPAIQWEGEKVVHTGGPWQGQRMVRSLKAPKKVVIIMVVANVQGLSKEKWDHISGKALHYGAHLVLLQEVGTAKDFDWHLTCYFRRTSCIRGP